jgi:hypothetical protein
MTTGTRELHFLSTTIKRKFIGEEITDVHVNYLVVWGFSVPLN